MKTPNYGFIRLSLLAVAIIVIGAGFFFSSRKDLSQKIEPPAEAVVSTLNLDSSGGGATNFNIVGIGTTNPQAKLDIVGAAVEDSNMIRLTSGGGSTYYWDISRGNATSGTLLFNSSLAGVKTTKVAFTTAGNVGIGLTNPVAKLMIQGGVNATLFGYGANENVYIRPGQAAGVVGFDVGTKYFTGGNVGVGTASPSYLLDVNGNARANGTCIGDVGHGSTWQGIANCSQFDTTGYSLISSSDGNYTLINKENTGSGQIGFRVGNNEVMTILNNGYVGIAKTDPAYTLDVSADVRVNTGWFRNQATMTGLYNQTNQTHFFSAGPNYWHINSQSGTTSGALVFYGAYNGTSQGHATSRKGWVYWDADGFGLLNNNGSWALRIPNDQAYFYSTAMYDANDGGYYVDPASTSNFFVVNAASITSGAIQQNAYSYMYPGRNDGGGNNTWYLSSNSTDGIKANTGFHAQGIINADSYVYAGGNLYTQAGGNYGYGTVCFGDTRNWGVRKCIHGGENTQALSFLTENAGAWVGSNALWHWSSSDIKLKKNITSITGAKALNVINQLQGRSYELKKNNDGRHYGFVAQEVEKIIPEIVTSGEDGNKGITYESIIPFAVEAIKEQQKEINELKAKNTELEKRIKALESKLK